VLDWSTGTVFFLSGKGLQDARFREEKRSAILNRSVLMSRLVRTAGLAGAISRTSSAGSRRACHRRDVQKIIARIAANPPELAEKLKKAITAPK
jgi:hypothetical protein